MSLEDMANEVCLLPKPVGRKYALNFALADDYELDANRLATLFSPEYFMVKITPLHLTNSCEENKIETTGGYEYFTPYKSAEESLKKAGFETEIIL